MARRCLKVHPLFSTDERSCLERCTSVEVLAHRFPETRHPHKFWVKQKAMVQGQTWCSFLISGQGERETDRFEQSCAPRVLASSYPIRKQLLISQNVTRAI